MSKANQACPHCDYLNPSNVLMCSMCGQVLRYAGNRNHEIPLGIWSTAPLAWKTILCVWPTSLVGRCPLARLRKTDQPKV